MYNISQTHLRQFSKNEYFSHETMSKRFEIATIKITTDGYVMDDTENTLYETLVVTS